jgi:uncharacterized protein (DUF697 family)
MRRATMSDTGTRTRVPRESLDKMIKHHMVAAFGAGLVPLPMVDFMAVSGVQLNLVRKLAKAYDVPFSKNAVQTIVSSLAGGAVPAVVGASIGSLIKAIPVVGFPLGAVSMPVAAAAMTYATGNVFIRHFDSDGSLLTFDIDTAREYFREMFKKGEEIASNLKDEVFSSKSGEECEEGTPFAPPEETAKSKGPKKAAASASGKAKAPKKSAKAVSKTAKNTAKTETVKKRAGKPVKSASKSKKTQKK